MKDPELLFTPRRFPLLPHRVLTSAADQLRSLAELCDAIGATLKDERWNEAGAALWLAVAALHRKP